MESPPLAYRVFQLSQETEYQRLFGELTKGHPAVLKFISVREDLDHVPNRIAELAVQKGVPCDITSLQIDVPWPTTGSTFEKLERIRRYYQGKSPV